MNRWLILALLVLFAYGAYGRPEYEFSEDGMYFRIYNPDDRAYYCIITLGDREPFEKILYPGKATRWYSMRGGYATDCST